MVSPKPIVTFSYRFCNRKSDFKMTDAESKNTFNWKIWWVVWETFSENAYLLWLFYTPLHTKVIEKNVSSKSNKAKTLCLAPEFGPYNPMEDLDQKRKKFGNYYFLRFWSKSSIGLYEPTSCARRRVLALFDFDETFFLLLFYVVEIKNNHSK